MLKYYSKHYESKTMTFIQTFLQQFRNFYLNKTFTPKKVIFGLRCLVRTSNPRVK